MYVYFDLIDKDYKICKRDFFFNDNDFKIILGII